MAMADMTARQWADYESDVLFSQLLADKGHVYEDVDALELQQELQLELAEHKALVDWHCDSKKIINYLNAKGLMAKVQDCAFEWSQSQKARAHGPA